MKLNYKNTIKVGFAFSIVMIFWTAYDFVVPLLLENTYGLSDDMRGLIMGLDNLLSLFLLPIFGKLSDNNKSRRGRRTPFIIVGTVISAAIMVFVPLAANMQSDKATNLREELSNSVTVEQLTTFYEDDGRYCDREYLERSDITKEEYINMVRVEVEKDQDDYYQIAEDGTRTSITEAEYDVFVAGNEDFNMYVQAGLNSYISDQVYENVTKKDFTSLIIYMLVLLIVLIAMATFRSPAVALMPDVTPKPLRSQGNAIINLMGGLGGALAFIIYTVWFTISDTAYTQIFFTNAVGMLVLLGLFLWLVNEPKLVLECHAICKDYNIDMGENDIDEVDESGKKIGMDKDKKRSFLLILGSIFMWFMGYNAVTSNLSVYTTRNLLLSPSTAGLITAISMGVSALAFIPVGYLAVKIGRKKSILIGFAFSSLSFFLLFLFVRPSSSAAFMFTSFYLIAGFGLIIANVNTFPMVVELSRESDVGKYTGYYYTATMSAQAITPFIVGLFMKIKAEYLFLYAAVCVIVAIVLMTLVRHGDSTPDIPKSNLELLGAGDD